MIAGLTLKKGNPILVECGIECEKWRLPYDAILKDLSLLRVNNEDAWLEALASLCEADFFMFCLLILELPVNDPYKLARCYEIQDHENEDCLWLWFRDGWKSTLITYARTLWRFCKIPDNRVALFSNSLKLAKPRFKQMKYTIETNSMLKNVWPDVFYKNPEKDAVTWTIDDGLFLKQNKMPWPSLGCFGLIDSMPTGGHYNEKIIDDLVDLKNIGTDFMMQKVLDAYRMSDNLGAGEGTVENIIGTTYKFKDLYYHIQKAGQHRTSIIAGEVNEQGEPQYGGIPVLYNKDHYDKKKIRQADTYWPQILMSPQEKGSTVFKNSDLSFYSEPPQGLYYYIIGEPASDPKLALHKEKIDFTCLMLIGAAPGGVVYLIDMVRDRIDVKKKWQHIKDWHLRYTIMGFGYEEFGTQKDREYFNMIMDQERFYIDIIPLRKDKRAKPERIGNLAVDFADKRIKLPKTLLRHTQYAGVVDLVDVFIKEEYEVYPNADHDDALDCLAKINDKQLGIVYPDGDRLKDDEVVDMRKVSPLDDDYESTECFWGGY